MKSLVLILTTLILLPVAVYAQRPRIVTKVTDSEVHLRQGKKVAVVPNSAAAYFGEVVLVGIDKEAAKRIAELGPVPALVEVFVAPYPKLTKEEQWILRTLNSPEPLLISLSGDTFNLWRQGVTGAPDVMVGVYMAVRKALKLPCQVWHRPGTCEGQACACVQ